MHIMVEILTGYFLHTYRYVHQVIQLFFKRSFPLHFRFLLQKFNQNFLFKNSIEILKVLPSMTINPIRILNICLLTNQIKIIKIKVFSVKLKNQISIMEVDLSISFYRNKSHLRTQGLKRYFWSPRVSTRIIVRTADHYSEKRNRKTHFDFDMHT